MIDIQYMFNYQAEYEPKYLVDKLYEEVFIVYYVFYLIKFKYGFEIEKNPKLKKNRTKTKLFKDSLDWSFPELWTQLEKVGSLVRICIKFLHVFEHVCYL